MRPFLLYNFPIIICLFGFFINFASIYHLFYFILTDFMNLKLLFCSATVGLMVCSCFDDGYNLDDIDTTSRVDVKDLVIPINFDAVKLSDIIKIEDDSAIKEISVNGKTIYAVSRTGDFDSDPIYIEAPSADSPNLESKQAALVGTDGIYVIPQTGNDFTFSCNNVDKSIIDIYNVKVTPLEFTIQLNTPTVSASAAYDNVKIQLPKGMEGTATNGSYDTATGVWTLSELPVTNGVAKAVLSVVYVDFTKNDFTFVNPKFEFNSNFSIIDGELKVSGENQPSLIDFSVDFSLGKLEVTSFSGKIKYEIEGMDIETVSLNDLPSFLKGEDTNIELANPLICLQNTNPVAADKLTFSAGLSLAALRDGVASNEISSDIFTIGYDLGPNGMYNTVLAQSKPDYVPEKFSNYNYVEFKGLGSILSGKGLPQAISVNAVNPQLPEQTVSDFELGRTISGVHGSYELFAPLSFTDNTSIIYSDTKDGWNKDIEDLVIDRLTLTATATNETPLDAQLTIYPLGVDGNRLSGVSLTSNQLKAGATAELTFTLQGEIKNLDGVEFFATVKAGSKETISPEQSIVFENIRVKVNGYYEKEL